MPEQRRIGGAPRRRFRLRRRLGLPELEPASWRKISLDNPAKFRVWNGARREKFTYGFRLPSPWKSGSKTSTLAVYGSRPQPGPFPFESVGQTLKVNTFMGRPPGRIQDAFQMRVSRDFLKAVDEWRAKQGGKISRAEAMRRLVELALKAKK